MPNSASRPCGNAGVASAIAGAERGGRGAFDRRDGGHVLPLAPRVWRPQSDQVKRLKDLETENQRLRRAIADLTLDKLILQEAARGNY